MKPIEKLQKAIQEFNAESGICVKSINVDYTMLGSVSDKRALVNTISIEAESLV